MEEISSTIAVPSFTLGKLKLMANTAALILNPSAMEDCEHHHHHHQITVCDAEKKENQVVSDMSMVIRCEGNWVWNETHNNNQIKSKEEDDDGDDFMLEVAFQSSTMKTNCSEIDTTNTIKLEDDTTLNPVQKMVSVMSEVHEVYDLDHRMKVLQCCRHESQFSSDGSNFAIQRRSKPLWGFSSICGMRQEMEDAVAIEPQLLQVNQNSKYSQEAQFFGVYDGHGGSQVANYCRKRLHSALIEEIEAAESILGENNNAGEKWEDHWKIVFCNCFQKVDDEVIGKCEANNSESNINGSECSIEALETIGSTAVVAILSQTHIIVANCGDSRAVLYRGKEAIPLSNDHKPNREDEWTRIEAAGGRVIHWNGYRVLGVLAVSRSIGDKYLKPWIIPEPEVKFVVREKNDECLILASDGLWDVMTNEEACQAARNRILVWHKKYGNNGNARKYEEEEDEGVDPAAQYAAEYLSQLALQRGSKDNVSVIVCKFCEVLKCG
ncbi:protein phosphatase 2C 50-like [Senna tora]|uniref:protein-serine/threonine phosphatase n=1 Tax=Senna tora TaxID=362788 RepID=A0A834W7E6_9FABA|nr:protein phosphatase 2C 50-like [Senna tora]